MVNFPPKSGKLSQIGEYGREYGVREWREYGRYNARAKVWDGVGLTLGRPKIIAKLSQARLNFGTQR